MKNVMLCSFNIRLLEGCLLKQLQQLFKITRKRSIV